MNGISLSDSEGSEGEYETEIMLFDRSSRRVRHKLTRVDDYDDNSTANEPLMQRERDGKK